MSLRRQATIGTKKYKMYSIPHEQSAKLSRIFLSKREKKSEFAAAAILSSSTPMDRRKLVKCNTFMFFLLLFPKQVLCLSHPSWLSI